MADTVVFRFIYNPYINLRTSPSTAVSELCVAPSWCAPLGLPAVSECYLIDILGIFRTQTYWVTTKQYKTSCDVW